MVSVPFLVLKFRPSSGLVLTKPKSELAVNCRLTSVLVTLKKTYILVAVQVPYINTTGNLVPGSVLKENNI